MNKTSITVAHGDGIGPEIMEATLKILKAASAQLEIETIEIGKQVYERGVPAGIEDSAWESLRRTKVFLKAPITTPQGGGVKSLNVTVRNTLGLYANVRPCIAFSPYVKTAHPKMNVTIIRENEEDLYAGIEYRQTPEVYQALKLISLPGCEKIIRYAFEYARLNNRKKVTCFSKDNIMKMADGLFHKTFDRIAKQYPEIQSEHYIIDIGTARLATKPDIFDVIVTENLYGDIISDVAAEVAGSVGLGGSSNIGEQCAMFEAIHGSAPDIAGKDMANPSGLLLAAIMMLVHICQTDVAAKIHNAWLRTLEEGFHTGDIYNPEYSQKKVGTKAFAEHVIANLGKFPERFEKVAYNEVCSIESFAYKRSQEKMKRSLVGMDVFLYEPALNADQIAGKLQSISAQGLTLTMISNRGAKVWPGGKSETFCTDHWRCRFENKSGHALTQSDTVNLLKHITELNMSWVQTEALYTYNGEVGFSRAQGE
ncbi:MAG: NADP-dependent isocitrate dehydrogenase [Gammaproteobacteria bacterium]|jgi:isocitrate dehydrogenase|nr:NADP-dependent isocitrate dehydrogenase [Gammaproteobacteria bacterium]